ncbi:MAG: hypothetical protein ACRDYY_09640, partial [Acidimicrobiales bacterium]
VARGLSRLARLAGEAAFSPRVAPDRDDEAAGLTRELHRRLVRSASARQLASWAMLPRPGSRPS